MKKSLLFLFACLTCGVSFAQPPAKLSRQQAVADIDTMVYYITAVHPDPFTVTPESEFRAGIEWVKSSLPDSIYNMELYLKLAPIVASLGDGHTSLSAERSVLRQWVDGRRFPLPLEVDYLTLDMTSGGRRVKSINGIPARMIVNNVIAAQSGESMAFRSYLPSVSGGWPSWVSIFYPADKYVVKFDKGKKVEAAAWTWEEAISHSSGSRDNSDYSYRIVEDKSTAILEFNSFNGRDAFRPLLSSMFGEIRDKGVKNLIIDLRANGGGDSALGDELFQYVSPVPFAQFGPTKVRISEPLRKLHPEYEMTEKDTIVVVNEYSELIPLRENPLRFHGNIYLLTSHDTFSSASAFAWAFQYFDMGTIVGSDTGGYINTFGDLRTFPLPFSHMRLRVSWKEFYGYGATEADRRPVHPDIEVPPAEALDYVLEKLIPAGGN